MLNRRLFSTKLFTLANNSVLRPSKFVTSTIKFKVGVCQLQVGENKVENLMNARQKIEAAASEGAKLVVLPEIFNSPYSNSTFRQFAEPIPSLQTNIEAIRKMYKSPSIQMLAQTAHDYKIFLVGGTIPEIEYSTKKYFNTCTVFNPKGELIAKYRKIHLFDVNIPNEIRFMESDTLSPGNKLTTFETEYCTVGLGICYDIRFPELSIAITENPNVKMMIFPGAFNTVTGPKHWELLQRARAVDNQVYVITASPARNEKAEYQAWGHSSIVNPWGEIIATTEHYQDIIYAMIDLELVESVRSQIPVRMQKRRDIYELVTKQKAFDY